LDTENSGKTQLPLSELSLYCRHGARNQMTAFSPLVQ